MESQGVFVLILAMITFAAAPVHSQRIEASENPIPVGSTVTFSSDFTVTKGAWLFENDLIVFIVPGNATIDNNWKSRVTFNSTTSSLTVRSLQLQDSGTFSLEQINSFSANLTLSVRVPISGVTLTANMTDLVEFNDTAVLMCSVVTGTSLSFVWLKDSSVLKAGGGVQFSNDGATLTIAGVTREYEGLYTCNVSNGISHGTSLPVYLNVSYGPTNPKMMILPMAFFHRIGSNVTVSCSAESSPPSQIQWMFNGTYLSHSGPKLQIQMAALNDSGEYKCIFHNTITSRFSSASAMITFLEPIKEVSVRQTSGAAIQDGTLTLHCEVAETANNICWWRNGESISADNSTVFDMRQKTLTINPVKLSDHGEYKCQAFNQVSNATSSAYKVDVFYGPMKPVITGPSMALKGTQVTLSCSSTSNPPSKFSWFFNGSMEAEKSELKIGPLTSSMGGKYICLASNNITLKNSTAHQMLTVLGGVTRAAVKVVGPQPIRNHTFSLTCEAAEDVHSVIWMFGGSQMVVDSTKVLSADNSTLTFDPLMDSDKGEYRCVASNPLSNFTSATFMLDVFYGPNMAHATRSMGVFPGENVTLICNASSNPVSSFQWSFNGSTVSNTNKYVTPPFTSDMVGMYTCMASNNMTGKYKKAYTMLTVIDVRVDPGMNTAIEGHVYVLMCNVTGTVEHTSWTKNGHPLHVDNTTVLSWENKTVTFNQVQHNDSGEYKCMVSKADKKMTSAAFMLKVNFGPKTPMITGPVYAETGKRAVFNCSAESVPPSRYTWWYNGTQAANTSKFTTRVLTLSMSGKYTCKAYNSVTGKNSTNYAMLTVIEAIEKVQIENDTVPIESSNLTLTCNVTGPYDKISWMKNNKPLNMSATQGMSYHMTGNTLHFTPVTTKDFGEYQCVATNKAGPHFSPKYMLLVNYGPRSVTIFGPDSVQVGGLATMMCSADSHPDCDFYWFQDRLSVPLKAGSILIFRVTNESSGTYICKATNPLTKITKYGTKDFTAHAVGLHTQSKGALMMIGLFAVSLNLLFN